LATLSSFHNIVKGFNHFELDVTLHLSAAQPQKRKISSRHESEIGKQQDLIFNSSYWNETKDRESVKRIRIK